MSISYVEVRLYDATGTTYTILPHFQSITFDSKYNDVGALENFVYPLDEAKAAGLGTNSLIGVVCGFDDGTSAEVERYVVTGIADNKVADGRLMRTMSGKSWIALLADAVVYPENWPVTAPAGHTFVDATPGNIFRTLILHAHNRGVMTLVDESTFSGTTDSAGAAWPVQITQVFSNGSYYSQILQDMMDRELVDAKMVGYQLRLYVGGSLGTQIAQGTLEIAPAKNATELSIASDATDACTVVLMDGEAGTTVESNATSVSDSTPTGTTVPLTKIGRRRERYASQSGIADGQVLMILANAELGIYGNIPTEETVGVLPTSSITPFKDFNPADWVWVRYDSDQPGMQRRVRQLAVSVDQDRQITVGLALNSILFEEQIKLQRKIDAYAGNGGAYGPTPPSNGDTGVPLPPSSFSMTSGYFTGPDGTYVGAATFSWSAPTLNTDGSGPISDLANYEFQWKYSSDSVWSQLYQSQTTNFQYSPLTPGRTVDARVRSTDASGNVSAWNTITNQAIASDTTAPQQPSQPTASTTNSAYILVGWDGKDLSGNPMPNDLQHVEVWQSQIPGFTPGVGVNQIIGTIAKGGGNITTTGSVGTTYYFKLIAVDLAGNRSPASVQVSGSMLDSTTPLTAAPDVQITGLPTALFIRAIGTIDPSATIEYHISTSPITTFSSATLSASTRAQVYVATQMPNGSPLQINTTYYVRTRAFNSLGYATTDGPQETGTLDPSGIMTLITASLQAGFILAGAIQVGQITIDSNTGITIPQPNGGQIHFPLDGSDAVVQAIVKATSLSVQNVMDILGTANIAGVMTVAAGVPSPSQAPSLTFERNAVSFTPNGMLTSYKFPNLTKNGSNYYWVEQAVDGAKLWSIPAAGGTATLLNRITGRPTTEVGGLGSSTYNADFNVIGIANVGGTWWCAYEDKYFYSTAGGDQGVSTAGWSVNAGSLLNNGNQTYQSWHTGFTGSGSTVTVAAAIARTGMSLDIRACGWLAVDIAISVTANDTGGSLTASGTGITFSINGGSLIGAAVSQAIGNGYTRYFIPMANVSTITSMYFQQTYTSFSTTGTGTNYDIVQAVDQIFGVNRSTVSPVANAMKVQRLTGSPGSAMAWDTTYSQFASTSSWGYADASTASGAGFSTDGTNMYFAQPFGINQINSSGVYTANSSGLMGSVGLNAGERITGVYYGVADFGAGNNKAIVQTNQRTVNATGFNTTRDTTTEWTPTTNAGGLYWDGSKFQTINPTGNQIVELAAHPTSQNLFSAYSWYDADTLGTGGVGGTHETSISPITNLTWAPRYIARITGVIAPQANIVDATRHDKANIVRIYGGTSTSVTLQATLSISATSYSFSSLISGAAPIASNFTTSTEPPGFLKSGAVNGSAPRWQLRGDGPWNLGPLVGDGTLTGGGAINIGSVVDRASVSTTLLGSVTTPTSTTGRSFTSPAAGVFRGIVDCSGYTGNAAVGIWLKLYLDGVYVTDLTLAASTTASSHTMLVGGSFSAAITAGTHYWYLQVQAGSFDTGDSARLFGIVTPL